MIRYALAAVALTTATAPAALGCTIDSCRYTRDVCAMNLVDCDDVTPILGIDCVDTAAGTVCRHVRIGLTP